MAYQNFFKNIIYDAARGAFVVSFSFDAQMVADIKAAIPWKQRSYDATKKQWLIHRVAARELYDFIQGRGFNVADSALALLRSFEPIKYEDVVLPDLTISVPLKLPLFPFQGQGVAYNLTRDAVLIGDTMGLGKTVQAIATTEAKKVQGKDVTPVLVICPAHLKHNWVSEYEMWTTRRVAILNENIARRPGQYFGTNFLDVAVVNYESLPKYFCADMRRNPDGRVEEVILNNLHTWFKTIIIDESHYVGNKDTIRWKVTYALTEEVAKTNLLLLSGTPLNNRISEIVSQLRIMRKLDALGGARDFYKRYGEINHANSGSRENKEALNELQHRLKEVCFYRREKHEVLKELPDKFRQVIKVPITNRKEYDVALDDMRRYLLRYRGKSFAEVEKAAKAELIVKINLLKQISAKGKITAAKEFADDLYAQGEKLITFAHHREVITVYAAHFNNTVQVVGGMGDVAKDAAVKAFQGRPDIMGIICSLEAASTGLTLTAASHVLFIELPWTSGKTDQAEDRAHRIGQESNVNCYYLLGENTIDEQIYALIQSKRKLFNSVTGANDGVEETIMGELFNQLVA